MIAQGLAQGLAAVGVGAHPLPLASPHRIEAAHHQRVGDRGGIAHLLGQTPGLVQVTAGHRAEAGQPEAGPDLGQRPGQLRRRSGPLGLDQGAGRVPHDPDPIAGEVGGHRELAVGAGQLQGQRPLLRARLGPGPRGQAAAQGPPPEAPEHAQHRAQARPGGAAIGQGQRRLGVGAASPQIA